MGWQAFIEIRGFQKASGMPLFGWPVGSVFTVRLVSAASPRRVSSRRLGNPPSGKLRAGTHQGPRKRDSQRDAPPPGQTPVERISVKQWLEEWLAAKKPMLALPVTGPTRRPSRSFSPTLANRSLAKAGVDQREGCRGIRRSAAQDGARSEDNQPDSRIPGSGIREGPPRRAHSLQSLCGGGSGKERFAPAGNFQPSAIAALLKVADSDWQGAILFGYSTGARLGDVANLRWSNLDIANGVTVFRERKTAKEAIIGLHGDFLDWLSGRPVPARSGGLCVSIACRKVNRRQHGAFQRFHCADRQGRFAESASARRQRREREPDACLVLSLACGIPRRARSSIPRRSGKPCEG